MSSVLKVPCLGRPFNLGMLYDAHSDSIIPGKSLWNATVLKSALQTTQQPSSNFEIIAEDTISKKSSSLGVEANLKLSLLGGMVNVSGAAKYLDDKKTSEQQARVTLKYSSTTHFEQLTMEQLGDIQHPQVLKDYHATHVVIGISFGSDAFFVFDRTLRTSEKLHSIHGNVEAQISWIPIQGNALIDMEEEDKADTQKLQCKFYGDVIIPSPPSTFDEAVKVYKDLPRLLENKSVPKIAHLHPLSDLDGKPLQIVCWITSNLIAKVEEIMESLHKMEMRTNDLMKHDICSKFVDIGNQFSKLSALIKRCQLSFSKDLAQLLPRIRSSKAEESELADLISSVHVSPFNFKEMERYLQGKARGMQQLAQVVKNTSKDSKVQCVFPDSECSLVTLTMDDDIEQVVCFAVNVTSDTSPYIENLEYYLRTKQCKPKASKEWYDNPHVTKMLKKKSKQFTQMTQMKSFCSKSVAFVVTDRNEETDSTGPTIIRFISGVPEYLEPPEKPGKPTVEKVTADSIDLRWTEPVEGAESVTSYRVLYRLREDDSEIHSIDTKDRQLQVHVENLLPGKEYHFTVQAVSNDIASIESDPCCVTTDKAKRLAEVIKKQSRKIESGKPEVYALPLHETHADKEVGLYKYVVGKPKTNATATKSERVLMVVGATGAGKSTLINGIANYVLGVTWNDNYRFKVVIDEGRRSQAESQTRNISAYTFHSIDNMSYDLTIVDTPGFGDTGGIERDKDIAAKIKKFFSGTSRGGIDTLHGIGFVAQASLPRLTPTQKYIFNAVLLIFGKDIVDNIFLLVTFADAKEPPVLAATKAADIPYKESFPFNNSALFASNEASRTGLAFNAMFWDMGYKSFESFFQHFSRAECRSLALTRAVLKEREQLENLVPKMQEQVKIGLSRLDVIQQEEKIIKQHEADILANKDFNYELDVPKFNKIPKPNTVTTTCLVCNFTCHDSCAYSNDSDKRSCCAIDHEGYCTACPKKCCWTKHANLPYHIEYYTVKEPKTYKHKKDAFENAKTGKQKYEEMVAQKKKELQDLQVAVFSLIEDVTNSINRLDEIALKPNPLTEIEYLDLLIQSEEEEGKPGWQKRIKQYKKIRGEAEMLKKLPQAAKAQSKTSSSWWKFWE